jgi:hypothetical protein
LPGFDKTGPFKVGVGEGRILDIRVYKTAVVKIGFVKRGIADAAAPEIDMNQFRALETAILENGAREGEKLEIPPGKITVEKLREIEDRHAHNIFGKTAPEKTGLVEITAVELAAGKVKPFKTQSRGAEILDHLLPVDNLHHPLGFFLGIGRVDGAYMGAAYGDPSAARGAVNKREHG